MKHHLYLLSLLRHIPETSVQARYDAVLSELGDNAKRATDILNLAETLARGNQKIEPAKVLRSPLECLLGHAPNHIIKPNEINLTDASFPDAQQVKSSLEMWKSFAEARQNISQSATKETESETTLHLLHQYAALLPNPSNPGSAIEEISWYDWAKSVAGIAVALEAYFGKVEIPKNFALTDQPLLLIGGDLSGIQKYITSIVSKGASKNLKGRSFYLHMLTESVVTLLLDELGLVRANVVYSSGGSFYIIAPNTAECKRDFEKHAKDIGDKIYKTHKNALALIMGCTEIKVEELSNASVCFDRLMDDLAVKKRQKNSHILLSDFETLFQKGVDTGGDRRRDAISGEEINNKEEDFYREDEKRAIGYRWQRASTDVPLPGPGNDILKTSTFEQIALGRQLRKLEGWAITLKNPGYEANPDDPEYFDPCGLGVYHFLKNWKSQKNAIILAINEIKDFLPSKNNSENVYGFSFYGGNEAPTYIGKDGKEKVLEFSMMTLRDNDDPAEIENEGERQTSFGYFRRLAVLRMDVDNLGAIFQDGVPEGRRSFAFYSALSRSLDWFFKGYLNTIWKKGGFKERSQIIYSGGDDLFIVGRWDLMLKMAKLIADDFRRYTGENPALGISGGVAIVTHKFPVIKASALAGTAEKKAKKHSHLKDLPNQKDAMTVMGEPLRWRPENNEEWKGCEYGIVEYLKAEIKKLGASNRMLGRGFCQRIQAYHAIKVASNKLPKKTYRRSSEQFRWKWLIAYDFTRLKDRLRLKEGSEEAKFLKNLQTWTISDSFFNTQLSTLTQYDFMDLLNVAARWAELEYRSQD